MWSPKSHDRRGALLETSPATVGSDAAVDVSLVLCALSLQAPPCDRASPLQHFDQGAAASGLQYIQSSTCLVDQDEGDGCFLCWPGSHAYHHQLVAGTWRGRSHWVPLTDDELATLRGSGLSPRRVPVRAGDLILWRSDLAHSGAPPNGPRERFRAVVYVSMLPAAFTPPEVMASKVEAYRQCQTGDHMPDRELWHSSKMAPVAVRPFYEQPPILTQRQAELHGVRPYDDASARGEDDLGVQPALGTSEAAQCDQIEPGS